MQTLTSKLPDDLVENLTKKSEELAVTADKIIETALRIYIDQLERAEYIRSYKRANQDKAIMEIAEEGMSDYLSQLVSHDENC